MGRIDKREIQRRRGRLTLAVLACLFAGGVAFDVRTPDTIPWQATRIGDATSTMAPGLVLQDQVGDLIFASMGFDLYRSAAGGPFEKIHSLVPSLGEAWAAYSRTFRERLRYHEVAEVIALDANTLVAFAGGHAYRVDLAAGRHERVHAMRYFGLGEGRGLMPHGLTRAADRTLYYGEYPTRRLADDETLALWRSVDDGRSWEIAHRFPAGFARHIHAVQWDETGRALWIATGDSDAQSRLGYSRDQGRTFTWIGSGSQRFRTCSLMFTETSVVWAMDAPKQDSHVLRLDRATGEIVESETVLASPGYFLQAIEGGGGLMTLAEREASLWWLGDGEPQELARWPVVPDPSLPHPSVRLLRSSSRVGPDRLLVNPLRTETHDAAIIRLPEELTSER